jgi:hypothetical protein
VAQSEVNRNAARPSVPTWYKLSAIWTGGRGFVQSEACAVAEPGAAKRSATTIRFIGPP